MLQSQLNHTLQVTNDDKLTLEEVLFTLSEKVKQRRVLVKPCFEDFDRYIMTWIVFNRSL